VANKALSDRVTGASAKAAVHLQNQNNPPGLFSPAGICLPFINELCARRLPMAIVLPCSFFNQCRFVLRTSKEVFNHTDKNARARACWITWSSPQLRNTRVASDQAYSDSMGVVAHDRFVQANLPARAVRLVRNTNQKMRTL